MSLQLLYHPLASFCWKVSIALYENGASFDGRIIDLADPDQSRELQGYWAVGKFPVLRDIDRQQVIPESSIIIEYLDRHYPGPQPLIPRDPDQALAARLWDRFFDNYVHQPMQKIVAESMRPAGSRDVNGIAAAKATLGMAYAMLDRSLSAGGWAGGPEFGIADCSAAPALFYAGILVPFAGHANIVAYFDRLSDRASFVRTIREAQPYFPLFPMHHDIPARFLDSTATSFSSTAAGRR
ncbi:MAG TPA: glutathione S-transferase family protein [Rudaea sp.]|jgi:glutathione S-transferase